MKPILLLCQKISITVFLHLDNALVLANYYTQAKEDRQRVADLLWKLGLVLILKKCQLEPTQEFIHLALVFKTQNMTVTFPE